MKHLQTFLFTLTLSFFANAQEPCEQYNRLRDTLRQLIDQNHASQNLTQRQQLYNLYNAKAARALTLLQRCINGFAHMPTQEQLRYNYLLGKTQYEMGQCEKANAAFQKCLSNPYCGTTKFGNGSSTYSQVIASAFGTCSKASVASNDVHSGNGFVITYSGKGGGFIQNMFEALKDKSILNYTPLYADEMEAITQRTVYATDTIDALLAEKLSGEKEFIYHPPFLFLHSNEPYLQTGLEQKKNLDFDPYEHSSSNNMQPYANFILQHYQRLKEQYFSVLPLSKQVISVYLLGGSYDAKGLATFLSFCNGIHYRAQSRVAYYSPLDNSVVAWVTSGGGTLVHELVHALIHMDYPQAPLWLNEGIASLNEEADEKAIPLDNYKLIYIQEAYNKQTIFINLADLLAADQYGSVDQWNYNMLNAYCRYLCKFILDKYGQEKLNAVYKLFRKNKPKDSRSQLALLLRFFQVSEKAFQQQWEDYLLKQKLPPRWLTLITPIQKEFETNPKPVFQLSSLPPSAEAVNLFQTNRKEDLDKAKTTSNGISTVPSNSPVQHN